MIGSVPGARPASSMTLTPANGGGDDDDDDGGFAMMADGGHSLSTSSPAHGREEGYGKGCTAVKKHVLQPWRSKRSDIRLENLTTSYNLLPSVKHQIPRHLTTSQYLIHLYQTFSSWLIPTPTRGKPDLCKLFCPPCD